MKIPFLQRPLFLLAACACASVSFGIDIAPPRGWMRLYDAPPGLVLQYADPDAGADGAVSLWVTRDSLGAAADASVDTVLSSISARQARLLPQYKVIEASKGLMGNVRGGVLVSSYARGESDVANFRFVYLEDKHYVSVVYACLLKDLPRLKPEFEKSLLTLRPDSVGVGEAPAKAAN